MSAIQQVTTSVANWAKSQSPDAVKQIEKVAIAVLSALGNILSALGKNILSVSEKAWDVLSSSAAAQPPHFRALLLVTATIATVTLLVKGIRSLCAPSSTNAQTSPLDQPGSLADLTVRVS